MGLVGWAYQVAEEKLASDLPRRWAHAQGVAGRAVSLAPTVGDDAELLQAAAILHDVGYAPGLAVTGFHPLDGANYLNGSGAPWRLVDLVAHHSGAVIEARLRGLETEIEGFGDEHGAVRDALWYCDLTTGPDGSSVSFSQRISEIETRYGPDHVVSRFLHEAFSELQGAVARTEERVLAVA